MQPFILHDLGKSDYISVWHAMQKFTDERDQNSPDELWTVEHPPVFTQGQAGKAEHILNSGDIPVIQTDRGGQVTYHGPGQLVVYPLFDLRRKNIGIRSLVCKLEQSIIRTLNDYGIEGKGDRKAPGVYVNGNKICSIGLRVRRGCTYHGLAFNVNMDIEPFTRINPCGFSNLKVIQLNDLVGPITLAEVVPKVVKYLRQVFSEEASTPA